MSGKYGVPALTEFEELQQKVAKEKGQSPEEYFAGRQDYQNVKSKEGFIYSNKNEYVTYVNVSIIEIAENKAAKYKLKDYDGFVRQVRNEPDIALERVDSFRRNGNYIKEYEKYVKNNEWRRFIPHL